MTVYINGVAEVGVSLQDVKDNVKLNELQDPDGAVALATQILDNIGAPADAGDALRKGTRIGKDNLQWASNKLLKGAGAGSDPTEIDVPGGGGLAIFGDGSDGDATISGDTSLTRDMFYDNLTVDNTFTLTTNGYRVFVKGTLTNTGTISNIGDYHLKGNFGSLEAGGNGGRTGADESEGGAGGGVIFIAAKTIINTAGIITADGNDGRAGDTTPSSQGGQAGTSRVSSLGGAGGIGGTASANSPGNGGTVTAPTAVMGGFRVLPFAYILKQLETTVVKISGGAGGGGGARSSTNSGGGGGGGGGLVVLIYNSLSAGSETAVKGVGGTGYNGGGDGADGEDGTVIKIVAE